MIKVGEKCKAVLVQSGVNSVLFILLLSFSSCLNKSDAGRSAGDVLADSISEIVSGYPGEIGVGLIIDNTDTVVVNDRSVYPMMSVFKLHQAIAVSHKFDREGISLDSVMTVMRDSLNPMTWSPMLKEHSEAAITLPVKDLLRYTLIQSDNNASNVMFKELAGVNYTDSVIATMIPRPSFRIAHTEEEMSAEHARAYANYTSPLGAAELMNRLFTDSLVSREKQLFIRHTLEQCVTGRDRIVAPLLDKEGVVVAHKTGSGYINERGELVAHNDVAYVSLPNGVTYTLAVFVKDFTGNEAQASEAIARVSAAVYSSLSAIQR